MAVAVNWQTKGRNNCRDFARATVAKLPRVLRSTIAEKHAIQYNRDYKKANLKLVQVNKTIESTHIENQPLASLFNEERLKEVANVKAEICATATAGGTVYDSAETIRQYCESIGIDSCDNYSDDGLIKRALDWLWWRRQLRKVTGRSAEKIAIQYGLVGEGHQIYCSDFAVERYNAMCARNRHMLENSVVTNEHGHTYTLQELSDKGIANPSNRRDELMTRLRGSEEYAISQKDAAVFITLTCPSKYHANSPKYNGADPRESQNYHVKSWARARASLARHDIHPYGFRVAEPHKDGTPHWHMLLFVKPDQQTQLVQIISKYWMREDGNEKGAHKSRVRVEFIDRRKGSAAGYIAKYISKNIDGHKVGVPYDVDGNPLGLSAVEAARRVSAWASVWGIRQFQPIGGAKVTIYRLLRRSEKVFETREAEQARINADQGNWDLFTRYSISAGLVLHRELTGEVNKYQELLPPQIVGVQSTLSGEILEPKSYNWEARRVAPWTCVNNCTGEDSKKDLLDFWFVHESYFEHGRPKIAYIER